MSWASSVISSYKASGEYDCSTFEEWRKKYERGKAGSGNKGGKDLRCMLSGSGLNCMPPGDDLNCMPPNDDDLNLNRMPPNDDDLNLNRMPPNDDDLNLNRMPPNDDDLNLNRMPPNDDDLNLNRMPPNDDDLNLNRMPPNDDDLNLNRMPPNDDDLNLNRMPPNDDDLHINCMPPIDLPLPPSTNATPFSCPVLPYDIPIPPSNDLPQPTSAAESQSQPSPPCPDFVKKPNFVPKCPKVQDLNKEKQSPGSMPSLPQVQPLSQSIADYHSVHASSLPSPPVINTMRSCDPPAMFSHSSSDSTSSAPSVTFPGPPSLPGSLGTPVMASPPPAPAMGNTFYSLQSSFQSPMYSGTLLSNADAQTCANKLLTVSSNLSRYVNANRDRDM